MTKTILKNSLGVLFALTIIGCSQSPPEISTVKAAPKPKPHVLIQDSVEEKAPEINYADSINYTDVKGLKQGQWIKTWNGHLIEKRTFVNDTLHGHFESEHGECNYVKGRKEGLSFGYYGKKESIMMVSFFESGERLWAGFPAASRDVLIPIKEFYIARDSVHIFAPYINGNTWYDGHFNKGGFEEKATVSTKSII